MVAVWCDSQQGRSGCSQQHKDVRLVRRARCAQSSAQNEEPRAHHRAGTGCRPSELECDQSVLETGDKRLEYRSTAAHRVLAALRVHRPRCPAPLALRSLRSTARPRAVATKVLERRDPINLRQWINVQRSFARPGGRGRASGGRARRRQGEPGRRPGRLPGAQRQ